MLAIRLFGGVSIERDGHALTGPFTQRHRLALLARLAAAHPRGQSRERLAAHLWPERPDESSRNLLNQSVHALRKGIGEDTIVSAGDDLLFEPGSVRCDVIEFQAAVERADQKRAVSLYSGPFLEGFILPGAVEFEHWVDQERERLRRACCEALEALAVAAKGAPAEAVTWWRRLAALEPYSARVAIGLMEALEASGDRAAALAHARVHASLLEEEFDAEPNPDVTALAERLRAAPVASGRRKQAAVTLSGDGWTGAQRTIAVLPFETISPDPEGVEWFVRAVREEISDHLAEVSALTVRPPETVGRVYGDGDRTPEEVASELQVALLLGGTVRVIGDRFRLTVRLVDVEGDTTLWQHRYEGAYTTEPDIFAVFDAQADVAERVASTLGAEPTEAELARIEEAPTQSPQAWSFYWQGRFQESKTTPESLHRALGLYDQAITEDQGFGEPYAGIASAYLFLAQVERWPPEEYVTRVRAAAERALQIDATLADPYRILGEIKFLSWDYHGAEVDFITALSLDPDAAMPHVIYSQFLNFVGRHEEAITQILRAKELDPIDPFIAANVGGQLYLARRYEEALVEGRRALELDDQHWVAHWIVGATHAATGRYDQAIEELQLAAKLGGGAIDMLPTLAFAFARAGQGSEAEEVLGQLREAAENQYLAPSYLAIPYAGLGENDRAFEWLERAYEDRDLFLVWVLAYPELDDLRPDPRFQTLMQKTGLSDYMAAYTEAAGA